MNYQYCHIKCYEIKFWWLKMFIKCHIIWMLQYYSQMNAILCITFLCVFVLDSSCVVQPMLTIWMGKKNFSIASDHYGDCIVGPNVHTICHIACVSFIPVCLPPPPQSDYWGSNYQRNVFITPFMIFTIELTHADIWLLSPSVCFVIIVLHYY